MRDANLAMERAVLLKTGRLASPVPSYTLPYLQALLLFGEESQDELAKIAQDEPEDIDWLFQDPKKAKRGRNRAHGPPKRALSKPTTYDEPVLTGDPVTDAWELAIARGEMPDLNG